LALVTTIETGAIVRSSPLRSPSRHRNAVPRRDVGLRWRRSPAFGGDSFPAAVTLRST